MKISFLILTWNRYKFLEKCLSALVASISNTVPAEILVLNNGSTDQTNDVLQHYAGHALVRVIHSPKHKGLNGYKQLFRAAKGEYLVIVDDDVLSFPAKLDQIFIDYLDTFKNFGFLALNVIQNEFTNGAKPGPEHYTEAIIGDKTVEVGPAGGWCAGIRKKDFNKIWLRFMFTKFDMKTPEDGTLTHLFQKRLKLQCGIIKNEVCFHASGPHYAKQYGHLDRELEKYKMSNFDHFVKTYEAYKDE